MRKIPTSILVGTVLVASIGLAGAWAMSGYQPFEPRRSTHPLWLPADGTLQPGIIDRERLPREGVTVLYSREAFEAARGGPAISTVMRWRTDPAYSGPDWTYAVRHEATAGHGRWVYDEDLFPTHGFGAYPLTYGAFRLEGNGTYSVLWFPDGEALFMRLMLKLAIVAALAYGAINRIRRGAGNESLPAATPA